MQCLHPIWVRKKTGTVTRASHFLCPERNFEGHEQVQVPCGKCAACLSNQRQQWIQRLLYEFKAAKTAAFVTLTYAPEHVYRNANNVMSVNKRDVQLFLKRFRKKYGEGIRYFCISEYGDDPHKTMRPHYHMLLFNYPPMEYILLAKRINEIWKKTDTFFQLEEVAKPILGERIGYVAGYAVTRKVAPPGADPNFMLCSRRPGIGSCYLTPARQEYHFKTGNMSVKTETGTYPLHRYFRSKVTDDSTRERQEENYRSYLAAKNKREFGFSDFSLTWTPDEVKAHGLTLEQYNLLCHNETERVRSWAKAYLKKQLHKHQK